ncbi:MAG: DUF2130 domain-containing protein [Erysipelotrichales bacterium]|nr:DUF2130 domain-containing protein [Erysipelotrichales bacterium]
MNEVKCPNCGTVFQIDESIYESIVKQVRDKEFESALARQESVWKNEKESAVKLAEEKTGRSYLEKLSDKDRKITELEGKLHLQESEEKVRLQEAVGKKEAELQRKEQEIVRLKSALGSKETEKELAVKEAISDREQKIADLNTALLTNRNKYETEKQSLKETFDEKLKLKDEQIAYYKDFKAKLSTKGIGESLEQHCADEFNKIRAAAFPHAYFGKDNDASGGTKGDFIFREQDESGTEIVSIMFEMKNEADETAVKHKNADFFKKLDKDRKEKNCEYAVLVTLLEPESDFYNQGIVDVSYEYPKMYVIRPQFFIPLITLLRNAGLKVVNANRELALVKAQNIDITNFEQSMKDFQDSFAVNVDRYHNNFETAIKQIDETISKLENVRDNLRKADNNLRIANDKAQKLTIKKLTRNNPTMKKKFEDLHNQ